MSKAKLINTITQATVDETAAHVVECVAVVEGGQVTGVRAVIKFDRPMVPTLHEGVFIEVSQRFSAEVPIPVAPTPSAPRGSIPSATLPV